MPLPTIPLAFEFTKVTFLIKFNARPMITNIFLEEKTLHVVLEPSLVNDESFVIK
jgi:hypothetical protein